MRSGATHLTKKKAEPESRGQYLDLSAAAAALSRVEAEEAVEEVNELEEPVWSVVSFDECEAGGLTYAQAVKLLDELDANHIPGLCIITDEAARRLKS